LIAPAVKKPKIIHPFVLTVYPVFFLYAQNVNEVQFTDTIPSLLLVILTSICLALVFQFWLQNRYKTAVSISALLTLFFSYGYVRTLLYQADLRGYDLIGLKIGVNTYLLPLWVLALLAIIYRIWRSDLACRSATRLLNAVAVVLMVVPSFQIATSLVGSSFVSPSPPATEDKSPIVLNPPKDCPDIYFIVLDGYTRSDILKRDFPQGNDVFIQWLQQKGFYVADKSHSNYLRTHVSLTATLNMDYMNDLRNPRDKKQARETYQLRFQNNLVFRGLKQLGYEIISFPSGYQFTDLKDAGIARYIGSTRHLNEFENELYNLTPFAAINMLETMQIKQARERVLFPLEHLATLPEQKSPVFVIAHILCPHVPFVFGPHVENAKEPLSLQWGGNLKTPEGVNLYKTLYADQVSSLNERLSIFVSQILAKPGNKPIVIFQADHGDRHVLEAVDPWPGQSDPHAPFSILNAFYFPDGDYALMYNSLSSVNTFRVLFNKYFGTNYPMLPDRCYIDWQMPVYDFSDLSDYVRSNQPKE
jgi:hypothetical protein